ncbi:MAG TPA: DUF5916 domain-containing protein [Gemmatimonadaceae bacterium]|nr:DUF5916 domain-containing protein [Gemmatimonadaceae bacterium]
MSRIPFRCAVPLLAPLLLASLTSTLPSQEGSAPGSPRDARVSTSSTAPAATAVRTNSPPRIDGRLDEPAWEAAFALSGFVQREPLERSPASERTEIRVLYDDAALYVAAWLHDRDPSGIVPGEARRDADIAESDALVLLLDTYLDRQNAFVFGTTPAGIEYDGQVTREGEGGAGQVRRQQSGSGAGFNKNWDGSWQVATSRDEQGWYAEFRIPFATLRYAGQGAQVWGLNVVRRIRRRGEESFWAPIPRQYDMYRVSLAGTLALEVPAARGASVTPFVLASGRRDYAAGTPGTGEVDGGLDAKVGLSSSLTLDLTLNTDFAQVEVDEEEINLTRFRLFFPEKRPFFLENAGTFAVGSPQEVELFFSRRIGIAGSSAVPIVGGGRLTGKVAGWTVGLLDLQTERLAATIDGESATLAPANNYSVVRVLRELPSRSRIGAILVNRIATGGDGDRNHAYGVDARVGVTEALMLESYVARTATPDVDGPAYAANLGASYNDPDWSLGASYREVQRGFAPEAGFLARPEYRFVSGRVLRRWRFDHVPWFRELRPHVTYREYFDLDGFSTTRLLHFDSHFVFTNGAFFQLPAINLTREGLRQPFEISPGVIVPPGTYDNVDWGFVFNTNLSSPLSLRGTVDLGGFYSGWRAGLSSTLAVRFSDAFDVALRGTYYDVHLDEGSFRASALRLRAAYAFTPRVYVQSLMQYNDQTGSFSSNVRFGWLSTAGTGLFIVYNDLEQVRALERVGLETGPIERAVIVKFTRQVNLR